jgi:hypothetical protein
VGLIFAVVILGIFIRVALSFFSFLRFVSSRTLAKSRTAEGEIHFAAFRLPAPRSAAWVKSQLSSTQSDQYPRRATRFPGRLERLLTCATDNSRYRPEIIPGVRCRYLRPSVHRGARPNGCGGRGD